MAKYRKKPVTIDATQWLGSVASWDLIMELGLTDWAPGEIGANFFYINTLEGRMRVDLNDWVIRGVQGEFYPCKADIFAATYEAVK